MENFSSKNSLLKKLTKIRENNVLFSILILALLIIGVLLFREILIVGLKTPYPLQTPTSGSMIPTLNIGDLLIVQGVDGDKVFADPVDGDIIVFNPPRYNPDYLVVHRAIEKFFEDGEWIFRTKGDANTSQDPWNISEEQVVGRVIWVIPYLGYIKIYLGQPIGIIITLILLLFLLFIDDILDYFKG